MNARHILVAALLSGNALCAQNDPGTAGASGLIAISDYLHPERTKDLPDGAKEALRNKMGQIITANGLGGEPGQRFILSAVPALQDKRMQATAPPMHLVDLELTMYLGDGVDGVLFASATKKIRGLGENETRAYVNALKEVKPNDPVWKELLDQGKAKIIEYYNAKCDIIIQRANGLAAQEKFEEALNGLMAVPEVCTPCYGRALDAASAVYKAKANKDCRASMAQAEASLAIGMYREAGQALATGITPLMPCYEEANKLMARIAERGKNDKDGREWDIEMRKWDDKVDLRQQEIEAWRAVGRAWGENQRSTIFYNVRGWW